MKVRNRALPAVTREAIVLYDLRTRHELVEELRLPFIHLLENAI